MRNLITSSADHTVIRRLPWPKRFDVSALCFLATAIANCNRVIISVAAPLIMKEYGWNVAQMGWVFSAFYLGYTLFMPIAGFLADRLGPKLIYAFSVSWWSLFTALTALPRSLLAMVLVRIALGIGESGTNPATNSMLVRWFPRQEFSRATGFSWSGGYAGPIIAFPLAAAILAAWGWRSVFCAFALLGFAWVPLWLLGVTDTPEKSRSINRTELDHIVAFRPNVSAVTAVPWGKILRFAPFWAAVTLHFCSNWIYFILVAWLPTYLLVGRHFSLSNMALGSALPFLSLFCGTNLFGFLIDSAGRGRDRAKTWKYFLLPFVCASTILILLPVASSTFAIVTMLCASMVLLSAATPIFTSASLYLAPRYAGSLVGIQNGVANLAGITVPVVAGYIVAWYGWSRVFWLAPAAGLLGTLVFAIFGKAEELAA